MAGLEQVLMGSGSSGPASMALVPMAILALAKESGFEAYGS